MTYETIQECLENDTDPFDIYNIHDHHELYAEYKEMIASKLKYTEKGMARCQREYEKQSLIFYTQLHQIFSNELSLFNFFLNQRSVEEQTTYELL